jgi:hypothetical protein
MKLSFVDMHNPAFLEGNLGNKITANPKSDISLELKWLDVDGKHELFLFVYRGKKELILPLSNVIGFRRLENADVKPDPIPAPIPRGKIKAQASTPQDHVFHGMGAGKTND